MAGPLIAAITGTGSVRTAKNLNQHQTLKKNSYTTLRTARRIASWFGCWEPQEICFNKNKGLLAGFERTWNARQENPDRHQQRKLDRLRSRQQHL
jgi:hypothetical protein